MKTLIFLTLLSSSLYAQVKPLNMFSDKNWTVKTDGTVEIADKSRSQVSFMKWETADTYSIDLNKPSLNKKELKVQRDENHNKYITKTVLTKDKKIASTIFAVTNSKGELIKFSACNRVETPTSTYKLDCHVYTQDICEKAAKVESNFHTPEDSTDEIFALYKEDFDKIFIENKLESKKYLEYQKKALKDFIKKDFIISNYFLNTEVADKNNLYYNLMKINDACKSLHKQGHFKTQQKKKPSLKTQEQASKVINH